MNVRVQSQHMWLGPRASWYANKDTPRSKLSSHKKPVCSNTYTIRKNEYMDRDTHARHIPERVYCAIMGKATRPMQHLCCPYHEFDTFAEYDDYADSNPQDYVAELWGFAYNTDELQFNDDLEDDEQTDFHNTPHDLDDGSESNEEEYDEDESQLDTENHPQ